MKKHTTRVRLAASSVAVVSVLLVAGCGGQGDDDARPAATASATTSADADTSTSHGTEATEDVLSVLSPWNTPIGSTKAALPDSDTMLQLAQRRRAVNLQGKQVTQTATEGLYVNTDAWTTPIVADGVPTTVHCRQVECGDGGEDITLDVPADVSPDPLYDGWLSIFDPSTDKAYDLWRARREKDGTISYQFMREWSLDGPGFNQPYVVSARGSGLPLFAGVIRPGELESGTINHAIAISLPGPAKDYFVQPASSTDGSGVHGSVPEGARLRLKRSFVLQQPRDNTTGKLLKFDATQRRYAATIVKALKTYGAIVVDRSAVPTIYFEDTEVDQNVASILTGYDLQDIHLDDFEVMPLGKHYVYPAEDQSVDATSLEFAGGQGTGQATTSGTTSAAQQEDNR